MPELVTKPAQTVPKPPLFRARIRALGLGTGILILCFSRPLWQLVAFAWASDLYSHILLIPFISLYLIWLEKRNLAFDSKPVPWLAALPGAIGFGILVLYWVLPESGVHRPMADYLAVMTLSFLCFLSGFAFLVLGRGALRVLAFPLAFLIFMIPFPAKLVGFIEHWLQHGSAEVAYWLFQLAGTPVLREDTFFQLPGFSLHVAPECSGIHSSLVLFIASLLAGYVLLRTGWRRAALAFAVLPLAFLRNGFRIFVIGELCVHVSPEMINSFIHTRGGPIFFALSLLPFFLCLLLLKRSEAKLQSNSNQPKTKTN